MLVKLVYASIVFAVLATVTLAGVSLYLNGDPKLLRSAALGVLLGAVNIVFMYLMAKSEPNKYDA